LLFVQVFGSIMAKRGLVDRIRIKMLKTRSGSSLLIKL